MGTIKGPELRNNSVTVDKIQVDELSAISANLGTVNAGTINGVTIRTSASGSRVELYDQNPDRMSFYDDSDQLIGEIRGALVPPDFRISSYQADLVLTAGSGRVTTTAGTPIAIGVADSVANNDNYLGIRRAGVAPAGPGAGTNEVRLYLNASAGVDRLLAVFPNGTIKVVENDV